MLESTISDEVLRLAEAEIDALWAGEQPQATAEADPDRINRIVERAQFEGLMADTVSFLFRSFGATLSGVASTVFSALANQAAPEPEPPDNPDNS